MHLLLDTHVLIWWHEGNQALGKQARRAIHNADTVFVSMATAWEAMIKISTKRLTLLDSIETQISMNNFLPLPIQFPHIQTLGQLPWHHRDPFDRMILAQAITDNLTLVTSDALFSRYPVKLLPAET